MVNKITETSSAGFDSDVIKATKYKARARHKKAKVTCLQGQGQGQKFRL